jgi:hypothetical protein
MSGIDTNGVHVKHWKVETLLNEVTRGVAVKPCQTVPISYPTHFGSLLGDRGVEIERARPISSTLTAF